MNHWLFKATPRKASLVETRRLAVEEGFLCRTAYDAVGHRADYTDKVESGDLIHIYFKTDDRVHPIGTFEVVAPEDHATSDFFGAKVPGTALCEVADEAFVRHLAELDSGMEGYEPDPVLRRFTGWPLVSRLDRPTPSFDDALFPPRRAFVPAPAKATPERPTRQFVAYHSAGIMGYPFRVEAGAPFEFLSSKAENFLRTMLGRPTWVIASTKAAGATRYTLAGLFTPANLTPDDEVWRLSGPGAQPPSVPDITDKLWLKTLLREQANFSVGLNAIVSPEVLAGLAAEWGDCDRPAYAEEDADQSYFEGNVVRVVVNRHERDRRARSACLDAHGRVCVVCNVDLQSIYGPIAAGVIHVHHRLPLASVGQDHAVDPVRDLVPVCPNCHAVIHANGLMSPEALADVVVAWQRDDTP